VITFILTKESFLFVKRGLDEVLSVRTSTEICETLHEFTVHVYMRRRKNPKYIPTCRKRPMRTYITPFSVMPLPTRSTVAGEPFSKMKGSERACLPAELNLNGFASFCLVATRELRGTKLEHKIEQTFLDAIPMFNFVPAVLQLPVVRCPPIH